jgi:hypothetical protein
MLGEYKTGKRHLVCRKIGRINQGIQRQEVHSSRREQNPISLFENEKETKEKISEVSKILWE